MVVRGFWLVRAETRRVGVDLVGERSGGAGSPARIGRVHRALAVEPSLDSDLGRAAERTLGPAVFGPGLCAVVDRSTGSLCFAPEGVANC